MDRVTALSRGMQVMLGAGILLLLDTFLRWQEVSVSILGINASGGANAWHGFWGIVMCLALLVLLAWLIARLAGVEMALPVSEVVVAAGLSLIVLLFAVLKNLTDDYSTKWSYIGIVLAGAVAVGAWLEVQAAGGVDALRADMSGRGSRDAGSTSALDADPAPPPTTEAPARAALERPDLDPPVRRGGTCGRAAARARTTLRPVTELPLTGSCLCGAVRFEIVEPLVGAGYCHCTRCQRRTGTAASVNGSAPRGAVRVTSGEDLLRAFVPEDGAAKVFCTACGGQLWSHVRDDPEQKSVRLGTIDGDPGVRPAYHQYVAYAAAFEALPDDGLPRYDERRPSGT